MPIIKIKGTIKAQTFHCESANWMRGLFDRTWWNASNGVIPLYLTFQENFTEWRSSICYIKKKNIIHNSCFTQTRTVIHRKTKPLLVHKNEKIARDKTNHCFIQKKCENTTIVISKKEFKSSWIDKVIVLYKNECKLLLFYKKRM